MKNSHLNLNEDLSEFLGVLIGDGCISKFKSSSRNKAYIQMLLTGNWKNDRLYYENKISPILNKIGVKRYRNITNSNNLNISDS